MIHCILAVLSAGEFGSGCEGEVPVKADLVLRNAKVSTVDPTNPEARWLSGENAYWLIGTDGEIGRLIGLETEVMDLVRRLVLPGFSDNHTHFVEDGFWLTGVNPFLSFAAFFTALVDY